MIALRPEQMRETLFTTLSSGHCAATKRALHERLAPRELL